MQYDRAKEHLLPEFEERRARALLLSSTTVISANVMFEVVDFDLG